MRRIASPIAYAALALCLSAACGNPDQKKSKQLANEAVSAANQTQFGKAEELLEEATAAYRDNHTAWYNLGQVRDKLKEFEGAADAYSEAARVVDSEAMYHYKLGKAEWNSNNVNAAQAALERAVELNPDLFGAQYELGRVYEKLGKPKEAAMAWTKSATLSPAFGKAFVELGRLYIKWDKLQEATGVLEQGGLNAKDPEDKTEIFYSLGLAYGKLGEWDKAIEAYTKSLDARESNFDALRQRGFAYAEKGETAAAIKDLEGFIESGGGGNGAHIQAANQRIFRLQAEQ